MSSMALTAVSAKHHHHRKNQPTSIYVFSFLASISGFLFGFELGIIKAFVMSLETAYDLHSSRGLVETAVFWGALTFTIPAGFVGDFIGRKRGIMISCIVVFTGSSVASSAINIPMIIIGLFINGIGIVIGAVIAPVYLVECAPKEIRGKIGGLFQGLLTAGVMFSAILTPIFYSNKHGWRVMLGIEATVSVIQLACVFKIPDSPRYLIFKGQIELAKQILESIREKRHDNSMEICDIQTLVKLDSERFGMRAWKSIVTIYYVRKALAVGCLLMIFQQLSAINVIFVVTSSILMSYGYSETSALWLTAVPTAVNFCGTFIGLKYIDNIGRKNMLSYSFYACALSSAVIAMGFFVGSMSSPKTSRAFDPTVTGDCAFLKNCLQCINYDKNISCSYCAPKIDSQIQGSCVESALDKNGNVFVKFGRCSNSSDKFKSMDVFHERCPNQSFTLFFGGIFLFMMSFAFGVGPVPALYSDEIFPLWARCTGNSFTRFIFWIAIATVKLIFGSMDLSSLSYRWFFIFTISSALAGWYCHKYIHETMQSPLEWIECLFMTEKDRKLFVDFLISQRTEEHNTVVKPTTNQTADVEEKQDGYKLSLKAESSADPDPGVQSIKDNQSTKSKGSEKSENAGKAENPSVT